MTREEAINQLKINKEDDTYVIDDEALNIAIKALEQESCEDVVSRDDVVRIVQHNNPLKALEKIRKLPSVTPQEPILDKIRTEIVKKHLSVIEKNDFESGRTYGYEEVLEIINKYKAESEGE